jgi:hypothetical protein
MTDMTNQSLADQAQALLALIECTDPADEPFYIGGFVDRLLAHYGRITAIWSADDVLQVRPDLTAPQALEVIEEVGRKHDAEYGINWMTLECMAGILFGDAPEADETPEVQP